MPTEPPIPVSLTSEQTQQASDSLGKHKDIVKAVTEAIERAGHVVSATTEELIDYGKALLSSSSDGSLATEITKKQAEAFSLFSSQVMGASSAFSSLTAINSGSFTSQLETMWKSVSNGKKTFGDLSSAAGSILGSIGLPAEKIKNVIGSAGGSVENLTKLVGSQLGTFARSADNVVKLRDSYFRMMGASGGLTEALARSGTGFENVNNVIQEQMVMISGSAIATGLSREKMVGYYMELGKIPGALKEQISATANSVVKIDALTATTRAAAATGRSFSEVTGDIKIALDEYNISGDKALIFVSRMTELSGKFNVEFDEMHGYMTNTARAFELVGNQSEGSANLVNKLTQSLKDTGLSGKASLGVIGDITKSIGGLNIAQKAFLSAQTGGAGGLMGGYQIDLMMKEGKIDKVFDMVRKQMTQQMGKIVTLEEAAKSPAAAAQFTRQTAILQNGPLGQFAKSPEEAYRILGALSKGQSIDVKDLAKPNELLANNMKTGADWQKQTTTAAHQANIYLEQIADSGAITADAIIRGTFTELATGPGSETVRQTINAGTQAGQDRALEASRRSTKPGQSEDMTQQSVSSALKFLINAAGTIPDAIKNIASKATSFLSDEDFARESQKQEDQKADLERRSRIHADAYKRRHVPQNIANEQSRLATRNVGPIHTPQTTQAATRDHSDITGPRGHTRLAFDPLKIDITLKYPDGQVAQSTTAEAISPSPGLTRKK